MDNFGDFHQVQTKAQKKIIEINRELLSAEKQLIETTDKFLADKSKANGKQHKKAAHCYKNMILCLQYWQNQANKVD